MFKTAAKLNDILPGGLISINIDGKEITLCNLDGKIYAIQRRCTHANASFELGSLNGYIITCPLHHAQFDIKNGERLSGPVPRNPLESLEEMHNLITYKVKIKGNEILIDI
jgi:nitrite reductase/ring-hydroxylating ferredoxin subunit